MQRRLNLKHKLKQPDIAPIISNFHSHLICSLRDKKLKKNATVEFVHIITSERNFKKMTFVYFKYINSITDIAFIGINYNI